MNIVLNQTHTDPFFNVHNCIIILWMACMHVKQISILDIKGYLSIYISREIGHNNPNCIFHYQGPVSKSPCSALAQNGIQTLVCMQINMDYKLQPNVVAFDLWKNFDFCFGCEVSSDTVFFFVFLVHQAFTSLPFLWEASA